MIECQDCLRALNPYIDRELSDEDIIHVRGHLEACGGCLYIFKFQESIRRLVRVRCLEQSAPESLRDRIAFRLAAERTRQEQRRPGPSRNTQLE